MDIADAAVQHRARCNVRQDAAALHVKVEFARAAVDGQADRGPFLTAHEAPRSLHSKLDRGLSPDRRDDVAGLHARLLCGAAGRDGRDRHAALLLVQRDGHADADVGIVHRLLIALVFLGREIIAPLVPRRLDHRLGSGIGKRLLVILVNEIPLQIGGDLRRLLSSHRALLHGVEISGKQERTAERAGDSKQKNEHQQDFFRLIHSHPPFRIENLTHSPSNGLWERYGQIWFAQGSEI